MAILLPDQNSGTLIPLSRAGRKVSSVWHRMKTLSDVEVTDVMISMRTAFGVHFLLAQAIVDDTHLTHVFKVNPGKLVPECL